MSKYSEFKKQLEENERLKNTAASDIGAVSFKEYERASGSDPLASFKANVSGIEASAALQKRATQNMLGTSGISGGYVSKSLGAIDKAKNAAINTAGAEALTESATNMNNYAGYVNKLATDKVNAANKNAETYNKTLYDITNKNMSKVEAENYIRLNNLGLDESQIQKLLKAADDNYKTYAANLENQAYLDAQLGLTSITDKNKALAYLAKQKNLSKESIDKLYGEWENNLAESDLNKKIKEGTYTIGDVTSFYSKGKTSLNDYKEENEFSDLVHKAYNTMKENEANVLAEYGIVLDSTDGYGAQINNLMQRAASGKFEHTEQEYQQTVAGIKKWKESGAIKDEEKYLEAAKKEYDANKKVTYEDVEAFIDDLAAKKAYTDFDVALIELALMDEYEGYKNYISKSTK